MNTTVPNAAYYLVLMPSTEATFKQRDLFFWLATMIRLLVFKHVAGVS